MLHTHGEQAIGFKAVGLAIFVQCLHPHRGGTLYAVVNAGHREAALFVQDFLGAGPGDFRVDEHQRLVVFLGHVDDDHAFMHIDLAGGQAYAFGVVHGFQHVVHQSLDAGIDHRDGTGHGVQLGVGVAKNRKKSHGGDVKESIRKQE